MDESRTVWHDMIGKLCPIFAFNRDREGDGKRDEGEDRGEKKKRKREVKQGKMREMMKAKEARKKAIEEMDEANKTALENMRFYKFYPVQTPDTPDISNVKDDDDFSFLDINDGANLNNTNQIIDPMNKKTNTVDEIMNAKAGRAVWTPEMEKSSLIYA
ncbi:hypothetical protein QJS10_CPB17g01538 [Acorus calamus]|uniref:Uncharacterized protein n=1 Tax=Acorus calamus TaxID=4465 RepID=A0AAV9CS13_ACOCL|nr:hypothetical protein QJS10_CPB17g01538 [Acorus calamus]